MPVALPSVQSIPSLHPKDNRPRILLIDDDYLVRQYVKDVLGSHYDVVALATGLNLRSVLIDADPDLVLLDIMLPWIDGYELCETIRSMEERTALPVIFLTGQKRTDKDFLKALQVGGDAYMTKPFSPKELRGKISEFLKGETD